MLAQKLMGSHGGGTKLYVEDVFSTYLYTGNGSTQTINNGIDLAGKGGMVWIKQRSNASENCLTDTVLGTNLTLATNRTWGAGTNANNTLTNFNSNGFSLGADPNNFVNTVSSIYASWTFRKAPKFFDVQTKVHTTGTPSTIDLSTLGVVGMVTVKSTVGTSNWFTWHKDLTAGNNLKLNLTDAQSTTNAYLSVSGTTLTISGSAPSDTYIVYAWAHDTSADGIIQCGSYVGTSSEQLINLGFEAQFVMIKRVNNLGPWLMSDTMRGMPISGAFQDLEAQSSAAEATYSAAIIPDSLGFRVTSPQIAVNASASTYIYLAIRRPNKPPTTGTEVYNAIARTGTGGTVSISNVGFSPDLIQSNTRDAYGGRAFFDRLRGQSRLLASSATTDEVSNASVISFDMNGVTATATGYTNDSTIPYIHHFFKRAKGFMDIVCYTGTGVARTVNHNLGVVPELMIVKCRSNGATNWPTWSNGLTNAQCLLLNLTVGTQSATTVLNSTSPTASVFTVGTDAGVNTNAATYVAYLFATLANVSKCFSYTGNGTSLNIECGFSTGARFVLCKRTDSTGDWFIFDSVRGIVASNDPHLSLNTTAAEVTTDDSIDPYTNGFTINQNTATNLNVSGGTYIGLAIA